MSALPPDSCISFAGTERIASGDLRAVAVATRAAMDRDESATILIFDAVTSEPVEVDLRGTAEDVAARLSESAEREVVEQAAPASRGPGRPKLGVVAREVTLLPRHWEWLAAQPGGASVTLRKLVEKARLSGGAAEAVRRAQESAFRFMSTMAGNEAGFEEATRALFADNAERFAAKTVSWPPDVRDHARDLASRAFSGEQQGPHHSVTAT